MNFGVEPQQNGEHLRRCMAELRENVLST